MTPARHSADERSELLYRGRDDKPLMEDLGFREVRTGKMLTTEKILQVQGVLAKYEQLTELLDVLLDSEPNTQPPSIRLVALTKIHNELEHQIETIQDLWS